MNAALPTLEGSKPYTELHFMSGMPERMMLGDQPEGLVLWPHGHEKLGPKVGYHMYSQEPELLERVDYLCGNPAAAAMHEQDTGNLHVPGFSVPGTDLNRAYEPGLIPASYEHFRALGILDIIAKRGYRWVLDLHTTTTDSDRFLIIRSDFLDTDAEVERIINASPFDKIARWPERVRTPEGDEKFLALMGLIGHVPGSVSVEADRNKEDLVVHEVMATIRGLLSGVPQEARRRQIYDVTEFIPKAVDLGTHTNFEPMPDGRIPILSGDNRYAADPTKPYKGFFATSVSEAMI